MKLYLDEYTKDGEQEYLNVTFWSFAKCSVLTQLAITGIIYGIIFILLIIFAVLSM